MIICSSESNSNLNQNDLLIELIQTHQVIGGGGKKGKGGSIIIVGGGGGGGGGKSKGGGWGGMLKKLVWEISVKKISEKLYEKSLYKEPTKNEIEIQWM